MKPPCQRSNNMPTPKPPVNSHSEDNPSRTYHRVYRGGCLFSGVSFLEDILRESENNIISSRPPRWPVIGVPGEVPAIDQHLLKNSFVVTWICLPSSKCSEKSLLLKRHFRILEGIQLRGWAGMYDHCTCNGGGGEGGRHGGDTLISQKSDRSTYMCRQLATPRHAVTRRDTLLKNPSQPQTCPPNLKLAALPFPLQPHSKGP